MLLNLSSIPTTVPEGFDVQNLPLRATPVSEEQMSELFGGDCFPNSISVPCRGCQELYAMAVSICSRYGGASTVLPAPGFATPPPLFIVPFATTAADEVRRAGGRH